MTLTFPPIFARLALIAMTASGFLLTTATVQAADTKAASFVSATASDGNIRAGVSAFQKGDYAKAITFQKAALNGRMSPRKAAVAQSNLCAALGAMGEFDLAKEACDEALSLRPNYKPAITNKSALRVELAKVPAQSIGGQ